MRSMSLNLGCLLRNCCCCWLGLLELCECMQAGPAALACTPSHALSLLPVHLQGVNIRVNMKRRGDVFGEVALMFNCPRSATVAATQNSVVWVLERDTFRQYVREVHETESGQLELFLNSGGWLAGWGAWLVVQMQLALLLLLGCACMLLLHFG